MYNITSLLYCSVIIYSFSLCIAALNCVATQVRERNGNIAQVCKFQETIVDKLVNWSLNLRWDTVVWTKRWFFFGMEIVLELCICLIDLLHCMLINLPKKHTVIVCCSASHWFWTFCIPSSPLKVSKDVNIMSWISFLFVIFKCLWYH